MWLIFFTSGNLFNRKELNSGQAIQVRLQATKMKTREHIR